MDLNTVAEVVVPTRRDELPPWQPGDAVIAGGTWLLSEPQNHLRRLVDVTALDWPAVSKDGEGIELAATCRIAEIAGLGDALPADWAAAPLFRQCATALLASFKIWRTATIGGNLSLSFPAGAMVSLVAALDGAVTVWRADSSEYTLPVGEFVTGAATNVMADGDILRSVHLPAAALRGTTAFRKIALSRLGRSGAVLVGRRDTVADGGAFVLTVTASTARPVRLAFDRVPSTAELTAAMDGIPADLWYSDAHGAPDWRRAVSTVLANEIRGELE